MESFSRNIGAGVSDLSPSDFQINIDTTLGAAVVNLPKISTLYAYFQNNYGSLSSFMGIRFTDVGRNAGVNNITFASADGDRICNVRTKGVFVSGTVGIIIPVGDNDWLYLSCDR